MTLFNTDDPLDTFQLVQDAVRLWVAKYTKVNEQAVCWHNEPNPMADPAAKCQIKLTMLNTVASGSDEIRRSYNEFTNVQTVAQVGIRIVTIQVLVEALIGSTVSAHTILNRLRLATQGARLSKTKELADQNISVNDMLQTVNLPVNYDLAVISAAASSLVFNVADVVLDVPEDWVENVQTTGSVDE